MNIIETKAQTISDKIKKTLSKKIKDKFKIIDINKDEVSLKFKEQISPNTDKKISTKEFIFQPFDINHINNVVKYKYTILRKKSKAGIVPLAQGYLEKRYNQEFRIYKSGKNITLMPKNNTDIDSKLRLYIAFAFGIRVKNVDDVNIDEYIKGKHIFMTNKQLTMDESFWSILLKKLSTSN